MPIGSVGGLATGLDTESLIGQLLVVERTPVTLLEGRKAKLQAVAGVLQTLNTKLLEVKAQADALKNPAKFYPRSVSSSAETVAIATADRGNLRGTFPLTVTTLAKGSTAAAGNTKSALTDTVAAGSGSFTFKLGASGANVTVGLTASTTLEQLVQAINDTNAGLKASAVNVGTEAAPAYKLTLTSNATGSANNIVIVTDDSTLAVATTQTAVDAAFSITGIGSVTRATNTVADVLDGVTITLKGAGSTDLAVDFNTAALLTNVQGLVNAYNDIVKHLAAQAAGTKGSDGRVVPGPLSGDVTARSVAQSLRTAITTTLAGAYDALVTVGVSLGKDGLLTLDASKLQKAVTANAQAVSDLIAGTTTTSGIADLVATAADNATKAVTGTITLRQDGITATIKSIQKQIDTRLDRLAITERSLRARFTALEKTVGKLQGTQSALTSQIKGLDALLVAISGK